MKKNEISLDDLFMEWIEGTLIEDKRFAEYKEKFEDIKNNFKVIGVQKAEETIIELIHEALRKEDNIDLRYVNMWGKELYDPDFLLFGISPGDKHVAEIEDFNKLTYDINPEDNTINLINKIRIK